jgi:hypothetical protein
MFSRYGSSDLKGTKNEEVKRSASLSSKRHKSFEVKRGSPFNGLPTLAKAILLMDDSLKFTGTAINELY